MLTENNFHHHNSNSVLPSRRNHFLTCSHQSNSASKLNSTSSNSTDNDFQLFKFDLHQAVRTNDVSSLVVFHSRLIQQPTIANTFLLDSNGHTPLYTAIAHGRLAIVDLLLHFGHNPVSSRFSIITKIRSYQISFKYCISVARESAMNVAIGYARVDIVNYLLTRGFPVDYQGFESKTPLERAIECNQGSIVVLLLKNGADWRLYEERRQTGEMSLVEWASARQHPQVLGVLIDLYGDDESIFNQIGMM